MSSTTRGTMWYDMYVHHRYEWSGVVVEPSSRTKDDAGTWTGDMSGIRVGVE